MLIGNDATNGGAAYATSPTTLTRCTIAEGGASQQGAAVYSLGATIEVRDSLVRGFSADASGGATTLVYADGSSALAVLDRVTWSNNELDAVASTDDATVVVRNNEGLTAADVQGAALLGCGDPAIIDHCSLEAECTDVATGITCFCFPDNVETDPDLGACASSGEMSSLVLGSEKTQLLSLSKDDGIATTSLFFPNTGDVFIAWGLAVTKNLEGLNWTASSTKRNTRGGRDARNRALARPHPCTSTRSLSTAPSSRSTPRALLRRHSPSLDSTIGRRERHRLCLGECRHERRHDDQPRGPHRGGDDRVRCRLGRRGGRVNARRVGRRVLWRALRRVNTGDVTGVVACSIIYSATADHHVGTCPMPALATGGFALTVLLGSELVGGSAHIFTVDRCPDSYVLDDGGGSCTCAAGQYELAGACVACADNHAKPSLGTDKADCVKCETVIGETSNAAHTACDACIAGYYNKGHACVRCPNYPDPCVDSSVLMPGYWRAAGDDDTEVLECPFGDASCPGAGQNQAVGRDQYCAAQYIGPLCSVCAAKHFLTSSQNECAQCNRSGPWLPTIMTGSVVVLCIALVAGACIKTGMKEKLSRSYKIGKTKGMMLVVVGQVTPTS